MDDKYISGVLFWFYASALDWAIKCKKSVIICDKVSSKIYIGDSEDEIHLLVWKCACTFKV